MMHRDGRELPGWFYNAVDGFGDRSWRKGDREGGRSRVVTWRKRKTYKGGTEIFLNTSSPSYDSSS